MYFTPDLTATIVLSFSLYEQNWTGKSRACIQLGYTNPSCHFVSGELMDLQGHWNTGREQEKSLLWVWKKKNNNNEKKTPPHAPNEQTNK